MLVHIEETSTELRVTVQTQSELNRNSLMKRETTNEEDKNNNCQVREVCLTGKKI